MIKRLLVDGDIVAYRSAGACKPGEPVEHARQNASTFLASLPTKFPDTSAIDVYVSGRDNFREAVAVTRPYKGNRDRSKIPEHKTAVVDYMIHSKWSAWSVDGCEPDDIMGCEQFAAPDKSTCIVSIDKDMDMIPGWHYNWVKKNLYYVRMPEANRNFYVQLLVGDTVDNIQGVPGLGKVTANKLIVADRGDPTTWGRIVREEYKKAYGTRWEEVLDEHVKLIWIWRTRDGKCGLPVL